jgi:hypothetical protein
VNKGTHKKNYIKIFFVFMCLHLCTRHLDANITEALRKNYLESTNKTLYSHILIHKYKKDTQRNTKVKRTCYSDSKFITRKVIYYFSYEQYISFPITVFLDADVMQYFLSINLQLTCHN